MTKEIGLCALLAMATAASAARAQAAPPADAPAFSARGEVVLSTEWLVGVPA